MFFSRGDYTVILAFGYHEICPKWGPNKSRGEDDFFLAILKVRHHAGDVKRILYHAFLLIGILGGLFFAWQSFTQYSPEKNKGNNQAQVADGASSDLQSQESCQSCHTEMTGFAASHNPKKIGCVACHLGDPKAEEKEASHAGMIVIPGNLADAERTCSTSECHAGVDVRVKLSLMNTMSGVVGVDKFFFGEIDSLDAHHNVKNLGDSAADTHLRNLCASCHLGQQKEETGPVDQLSRGGGCNACHLNYSQPAQKAHDLYVKYQKKILPKVHPTLSLNVSKDHCFGCHSRSGRLSTNYEGWHETQLSEEDVVGKPGYRILEDERVFTFVKEDVHHAQGMECVDCHGSYDVMGSGTYAHQEDAVKAACEDCHTNEKPLTVLFDKLNPDDQRILKLRGFDTKARFVVGEKSKVPLYNVTLKDDGSMEMIGKLNHKKYKLTPPGELCSRGGVHSDIMCSACHTSWAPQCISCHTSYDPKDERYDLLDHKMVGGSWLEKGTDYLAEYPALGIVKDSATGARKIKTFIPGMVMTLDKSKFSGKSDDVSHHRLYAPASAHTISAKGQGCKKCHNNPVALGYGRGKLTYNASGEWSFQPKYPLWNHDGLPEDAWIGFLKQDQKNAPRNTTRTHARPFNLSEQKQILKVGACLTCHEEDSPVARGILKDFEQMLKKTSPKCVLPK